MTLTKSVRHIIESSNDPLLSINPSWERVQLGEIASILNGFAFKSRLFNNEKRGVPLLRIRDISTNESNTYFSGDYDEQYIVSKGDIVVGMDGDFNCSIWKGVPSLLNQRVCKIESETEMYSKDFLFLVLPHYLNAINEHTSSQTVKHLSSKSIQEILLPLPPLSEQNRIVAAIKSLFARLDETNERLDRVPEIMKVFRQAVLVAACDGRLTEEWRKQQKDLPDPEELQEQISRAIKEATAKSKKKAKSLDPLSEIELDGLQDIPENWLWIKIGDLTLGVEYGTSAKSNESGEVPVLRMGNIQNGRFDWSNLVYTNDKAEIAKYLLTKDDVLFNRTNSPDLVGKTAIYKGEKTAIFAGYLIRINQLPTLVSADYLNYYLNSPAAKLHGNSVRTDGVNQSNINGEKLRNYPFPFCSLPEQQEIVRRVDALFAFADSIEARVAAAKEKTERLRQSILAKAFSGELVPTEAELARQEGRDYESAEVLLERIKAEGASSKKKKK
ncbi:MAG: type restriction enzyme subunit [Methanolobus sp.]|nr:type restriction enzyme subunit [Methanolobus sp.]